MEPRQRSCLIFRGVLCLAIVFLLMGAVRKLVLERPNLGGIQRTSKIALDYNNNIRDTAREHSTHQTTTSSDIPRQQQTALRVTHSNNGSAHTHNDDDKNDTARDEMQVVTASIENSCRAPKRHQLNTFRGVRFQRPFSQSACEALKTLQPMFLKLDGHCASKRSRNNEDRRTLKFQPEDYATTDMDNRVAILVSGEFRGFRTVNWSLQHEFFGTQPNSDAFLNMRIQHKSGPARQVLWANARRICETWRGNGGAVACRLSSEKIVGQELACYAYMYNQHFNVGNMVKIHPRNMGNSASGDRSDQGNRFIGQIHALWEVYALLRHWEAQHPNITYTTLLRVRSDAFFSIGAVKKPYPYDVSVLGGLLAKCGASGAILYLRVDNHAVVPRRFGDCFFGRFQNLFTKPGQHLLRELHRIMKASGMPFMSPEALMLAVTSRCGAVNIVIRDRWPFHENSAPREFRRLANEDQ